jgi:hypothetical protein
MAGARGAHLIEAEPARNHGQPGTDILDLVEVGAGQPQKRFLRNVFGVPDVSQHLVPEIDQVRAMPPPSLSDLVIRGLRLAHVVTTI